MASDDEDVPDSGAVFTFGRSRFLDNKFWIRDDAVIHLACGDEHSAVITENGKLYTFGSNDWGQLGHGNTVQFPNPKLVKRLKPEKVTLVAAGRNHTIVSTESGKLFSFGSGTDGQLGHGDCQNSTVPKAIESLEDQQYKVLACGADFSAAVTVEGELYTWGSSAEGQTGQRNEECVVPTRVHLKGKVTAVACGYYHMAVATDNGSLYTCGEYESGKLGLDKSQLQDTSRLQKLFINEQVTAVACGGNHTAVVTASGKLFTFGQGDHGQLGHGTSTLQCSAPKQVTSIKNICVKFVACGESHTAVITKHGNLYTCGDGRHGKLGMGEESFSNLFKLEKVTRFNGFTAQNVACGGCHTIVTAFKTSEVIDGTDSEAEAERDMLSASVSSSKSLQDAVDGPSGPRGGLAATFPVGGAARNKRRLKNMENLGNSVGGSLPPISKSTLPPLSRTLPALKKEPVNQEKIPVNPLNMSTLPKISQEDRGSDQKDRDKKSADELKSAKPSKREKDAESSSGISESEEDEEGDDEGQDNKNKEETAVTKVQHKKDEESDESMTADESDSGEEESGGSKRKTEANKLPQATTVSSERDEKKGKVPSTKEEDDEDEEESESESESEEDEETDDEEDDEDGPEDGKKTAENEQLEVVGKKLDVTKVEKMKKDDEDEDEESEEEESDEEDEDDDDEGEAKKKNVEEKENEKKAEAKGKGKETKGKKAKKEKEEETEEEEDEDEGKESGEDEQAEDTKKDKKAKDAKDGKKKKQKQEKNEDDETSNKKDKVDKKDKNKNKKGKDKGSKKENNKEEEEEEGEEEEEEDAEAREEDETENDKEEANKDKKDKKEGTAGKSEAAKKEKKSGICVIL